MEIIRERKRLVNGLTDPPTKRHNNDTKENTTTNVVFIEGVLSAMNNRLI